MQDLTQHPRYQEACDHARAVRGFYSHALVYVLVNAALIAMNALDSGHRWWALWTTLWWGVGLAAHGVSVFVMRGGLGRAWEEREIRRYLERRG